jgi:hypothetical protein
MREELHQKLKIARNDAQPGQLVEQLIKENLNEMLRAGIRPIR